MRGDKGHEASTVRCVHLWEVLYVWEELLVGVLLASSHRNVS